MNPPIEIAVLGLWAFWWMDSIRRGKRIRSLEDELAALRIAVDCIRGHHQFEQCDTPGRPNHRCAPLWEKCRFCDVSRKMPSLPT